jgi:2,4'-dihydroxyacetophenone dioxygenase
MQEDSSHQLSSKVNHEVGITTQLKSAFFDMETLEWSPWVMEDTWFKLLSINTVTGGFTMMLKVAPNNIAPVHGHLGSVEGVILEGSFAYEDDWGHAGNYVQEPAGINHAPVTGPDGLVMFATAHGPIAGYNEDGSVAKIVDARAMFDMAEATGSVGHLDKPAHWID